MTIEELQQEAEYFAKAYCRVADEDNVTGSDIVMLAKRFAASQVERINPFIYSRTGKEWAFKNKAAMLVAYDVDEQKKAIRKELR